MSRDHWDAILASAPLNATAGAVTSKGYQYEPDKKITAVEWDAPPAMARIGREHTRNASFVDFSGRRFGRLTVLGMVAERTTNPSGDKGALWVCRCACGRYCGRRAKTIRKANPDDRCQLCQHAAFLAKSASGNNASRRAESDKARKW